MPAILPTWASAPLAVTSMVPLPWVTGVFMNAMFFWSPAPISASRGCRLLGSRRALPREGRLVDAQRVRLDDPTVGGHVVAGSDQHDVAEDDLLDGDRRLDAVATHACGLFVSDLRAFMALSALPSWRRPTTALNTVSRISTAPVLHSPMASDRTAAMSRMICM